LLLLVPIITTATRSSGLCLRQRFELAVFEPPQHVLRAIAGDAVVQRAPLPPELVPAGLAFALPALRDRVADEHDPMAAGARFHELRLDRCCHHSSRRCVGRTVPGTRSGAGAGVFARSSSSSSRSRTQRTNGAWPGSQCPYEVSTNVPSASTSTPG
jgi:hypothetical protein